MNAPADARLRDQLRAQAAVLVWFDDWWLSVPGEADEVDNAISDFLMEDCRRVPGPDDEPHWAIHDLVRRRTLRSIGPAGARQSLRTARVLPIGLVQRSLCRVVEPETVVVDGETDTAETLAAELQVLRWVDTSYPVPRSAESLENELARLELVAPLLSLSAGGFFGREPQLRRLEQHLRDGRGPLVVSGVGGVGKSTLLAKFITDQLETSPDLRFAYLNFDRGALAANQPALLLAEILRQVMVQETHKSRRIQLLIEDLEAQESYDEQAGSISSHSSAAVKRTYLSRSLFATSAKLLRQIAPRGLVVVLDTFEEVQRRRSTDLFLLRDFLEQLQDLMPSTRVVIAGRALDDDLADRLGGELLKLDELSHPAAMRMILEAPGVDVTEEAARRTIGLVTANPLSLRLAIEILRDSKADDPLLDLELQEGQIQGVLYRRILLHIENPVIRKIAHPGLVVRVVTPDVIRHVLARPCMITVADDLEAEYLFDELENEATLVSSDGRSLRHRSDVRQLMLPALQRDQKPQVAKIHRAAIRYYRTIPTTAARAEELYHRLMLQEVKKTVDSYWDQEALPLLLSSVDELPARGQQYLWARSNGEISIPEEVMREADDQAWAAATGPTAVDELRAGRPKVALQLVRERRGPDGESLLPAVEVEALEALRQFESALPVIARARDAALRQRRSADAVSLTLDVMRVLERLRRFDDAIHEAANLRGALTAGHGESALDYLVASASYLRLLRRSGKKNSDEYVAGVADAVDKAERLTLRELGSRAGLTRELLAEIGDASSKLLRFAIENVGVARGQTDRLDAELNKKVDPAADGSAVPDPDDEPLAAEPRNRTGNKVSEYFNDMPGDAELSQAISESWQDETDELYS